MKSKIAKFFQLRFFYDYYIKRDIDYLMHTPHIHRLKREVSEKEGSKKLKDMIFVFTSKKIIKKYYE